MIAAVKPYSSIESLVDLAVQEAEKLWREKKDT